MHKKFHYIWGSFTLVIFLTLAVIVHQNFRTSPMDSKYLVDDASIQKFVESFRSASLTSLSKLINVGFGPEYGLFLAAAAALLILIFKKANRWLSTFYLAALVGVCSLGNPLVKELIKRTRPAGTWLISEGGLSFPSGHAIFATSLMGGLFLIFCSSNNNHFLQVLVGLLSALVILTVAASRVYLGVHYPSDVIGGMLLGFAILHLSYPLYYRLSKKGAKKFSHQR